MKKILENLKLISVPKAIFAALFSLMIVLSRHVVNINADRSTIESTYFTDIHGIDLLFWIAIGVLVYLVCMLIPRLRYEMFFEQEGRKTGWVAFAIGFLVIAVLWLPYIFSFWPAGIYSDTMYSIWIALGTEPLTTHEPLGYTLLWKIMYAIGGGNLDPGNYGGMYLFTVVQYVGMAALLASFAAWNYKRGLKKGAFTAMILIFALVPIFPFYALSLWKDTVFGIVIFLYSWFLFCLCERIKASDGDVSRRDVIVYGVMSVLCAFYRNNGIYVMILVSIFVVLSNLKLKKVLKKLGITSAVTIAVCLIIQYPVCSAIGLNVDKSVESLAIPLEQTAYIIATDGQLSENDINVINEIMPIEMWKDIYSPINTDYLKFDPSFNASYVNDNPGKFLGTYIHMCLKNPVKAVKGYLLATTGFWDMFEDTGNAFKCTESISWTGVYQEDWFSYKSGVEFRSLVEPRRPVPAAIWVWIMLFAFFMIMDGTGAKKLTPMIPPMGVWITIMLAVPLAFSFRYIFAVFLCLPIYWLCGVYGIKDNRVQE